MSSREYFARPISSPPPLADIDLLALREWLAHLYESDREAGNHTPQASRRTDAVPFPDAGRRVADKSRAPTANAQDAADACQSCPNAELTNNLVDGRRASRKSWSGLTRNATALLFELLYGCGLRISEAVGLNWKIWTAPSAGFASTAKAVRCARCHTAEKAGLRWTPISRCIARKSGAAVAESPG